MADVKDWLNQKFVEWEKTQGTRQSYYAFARYLEVSHAGLAQWMTGSGVPGGEDVLNIAGKLGPEIYELLGLPRPDVGVQRVTVSFASLPADIRERLTGAIAEADETLRRERLRPDTAEARRIVIEVLARWGFRYNA